MDLQLPDIIFIVFIVVVVLGGVVCLLIFLPKEHSYEDSRQDCYRIKYSLGEYKISHKKATYGENSFALRSKYFYITKVPFSVEAFCDGKEAADGKTYRAAALVTVYFPEDKLETFAPTFQGANQESIEETISEAVSNGLADAVEEYRSEMSEDEFGGIIKDKLTEKVDIFGLIVMKVNSFKLTEAVSGEKE